MTDLAITSDAGLDLDPLFGFVEGRAALAQAIALRLDTPHGGLWYDLDYGCNLKRWLNATLDASELFRMQQAVMAECMKDERVLACDARVTLDAQAGRLRVSLALTDDDGPFALELDVSSVRVAVLEDAA